MPGTYDSSDIKLAGSIANNSFEGDVVLDPLLSPSGSGAEAEPNSNLSTNGLDLEDSPERVNNYDNFVLGNANSDSPSRSLSADSGTDSNEDFLTGEPRVGEINNGIPEEAEGDILVNGGSFDEVAESTEGAPYNSSIALTDSSDVITNEYASSWKNSPEGVALDSPENKVVLNEPSADEVIAKVTSTNTLDSDISIGAIPSGIATLHAPDNSSDTVDASVVSEKELDIVSTNSASSDQNGDKSAIPSGIAALHAPNTSSDTVDASVVLEKELDIVSTNGSVSDQNNVKNAISSGIAALHAPDFSSDTIVASVVSEKELDIVSTNSSASDQNKGDKNAIASNYTGDSNERATLQKEAEQLEVNSPTLAENEKNQPLPAKNENKGDKISSNFANITFTSGIFTVGETGKVSFDYLYDGGWYQGQLATFSLAGMEEFQKLGVEAFIAEAMRRSLSNSPEGYVVISDIAEGARFSGNLAETDMNLGEYQGIKTFDMTPGDKFGVMLLPSGTIAEVLNQIKAQGLASIAGSKRPLFSLAPSNPAEGFNFGQVADVVGDRSTFVFEDMRVDKWTDKDYNDFIFQVKGAVGETALMKDVINPNKKWDETELGKSLINYATREVEKGTNQDGESQDKIIDKLPDPVKYSIERSQNLDNYQPEALESTQQWLVGVTPSYSAEEFATLYNAENVGASGHIPNSYIWNFSDNAKPTQVQARLDAIDGIEFAYPLVSVQLEPLFTPNDEFFKKQWHLQNTGQTGGKVGTDANVTAAWDTSRGEGVVIGIVDDGLQYAHPDLKENYRPDLSVDFNEGDIKNRNYDTDPAPFSKNTTISAKLASPKVIVDDNFSFFPLDVGLQGIVEKLKLTFDITHSFPGELKGAIVSPKGTEFQLSNLSANGEHSLETDWFKGEEAHGEWHLVIEDTAAGDEGQLNNWSLTFDVENSHGTAVTGVAAANGNNSLGVSGVAPEASIAGLRLIANKVIDTQIADALYADSRNQAIDILNNSWKPLPFWSGAQSLMALHDGVTLGREGLGNIYVFGAGNDGDAAENLNSNAYANSRYAIAVGAIDHTGKKAAYSQEGSSLFLTAPSSSGNIVGITTTDLTGSDGRNASGTGKFGLNYANLDYTNDFGGTSSATPVVSGVVGLMLETNPTLTWRDAKHILAETANRDKINDSTADWSGKATDKIRHSQKYGFGIIDAAAAVSAAANWTTVAPEVSITSKELPVNKTIPDGNPGGLTQTFTFNEDITVESVEVVFDATHLDRGNLMVELISPDGTKSILANPSNDKGDNYDKWTFTSVRQWGESSKGDWKLRVSDWVSGSIGTWDSWKLNVYGTKPTISISANDPNASEGGNPGEFAIARTGNTKFPLTVNYSVAGSAANTTDYNALSSSITIPAGISSVKIPIIPIDDTTVEGNETVIVNLAAGSAYNLGTHKSATVNIADNDFPNIIPTLTTVSTLSGATQNKPFTITYADLSNAANEADADGDVLSFQIEGMTSGILTKNGVAVVPGVTTLAAGEQLVWTPATAGVAVPAFTMKAFDGKAVSAAPVSVAIAVASLPTVTVNATDPNASENGDFGQFTVSRSGSTDKSLTLNYSVAGTATNGSDYNALNGNITIPVGASSVTIPIAPIDDAAVEGNETVVLNLIAGDSYQVGTVNSATVNIADNELFPTVMLAPINLNASESGMPGSLLFFRTNVGIEQSLTVNYSLGGTATNGTDYQALTGSVTIPAYSFFASIPINPNDDSEFEGDETVVVSLAAGNYNILPGSSYTLTIADNDKPTVTLIPTDPDASESGDSGQFTITRTGTTKNPLTVNYSVGGTATNGGDYNALSGSITIPANASTAIISINPNEDVAVEGNETVVLNLAADSAYNVGTAKSATVAIADNDTPPSPFTKISTSSAGGIRGSAVWGDYDNDNDLDIFLSGLFIRSQVYQNDSKSFTATGMLSNIWYGSAAEWGDYDNDNDLDLILASGGGFDETKLYRNEGSSFTDSGISLINVRNNVSKASITWGDYDNDGDLDLLMTGDDGQGISSSTIYRNDGHGNFMDISASLIGIAGGSSAWGDYDNDGDLDIILTGWSGSAWVSQIYRNDGYSKSLGWNFTNTNAFLQSYDSAAWGDYDSDGDLDLLLTGPNYSFGSSGSSIYRNDGNDRFTDIRASLPILWDSSAAWGDYDNDGDLDILLTGWDVVSRNTISKIYKNNGDSSFTDINLPITGISKGSVAWGDYDRDGDLDILLNGQLVPGNESSILEIYQNNAVKTVNTTPTAPTNLKASVNDTSVTLNWNPATDAQTPQQGLTYNLRVGTTPGGSEIMSPMASSDGTRKVVQMGNVNHNTDWTLNNLKPGTYYWSVQAIDTAFEGSPFATEGSFTVDPPEPELQWIRQQGTALQDFGRDVAVDNAGNAYIVGFTGEGDILSSASLSTGKWDAYISKYDKNGKLLWTQQSNNSKADTALGVSVDSANNVYMVGSIGYDAYAKKYDSSGNEIWYREFSSKDTVWVLGDSAQDVSVDNEGNIYITGGTVGSFLNPWSKTVPNGDVFITKYDTDGNRIWLKEFGTTKEEYAWSTAVDTAGNIYVVGWTEGSLNGSPSDGSTDAFVTKYDKDGNQVWLRQFGTVASDLAYGVTADSAGNIYISGYTRGAFNGNNNIGGSDSFIAKYDSNGNSIWMKQFGTANKENSIGLSVDSNGNIYVSGLTQGSLDDQTNAGMYDAFITRFDSNGNRSWSGQWGTAGDDELYGLAIDKDNNIYVVGNASGSLADQSYAGAGDASLFKYKIV